MITIDPAVRTPDTYRFVSPDPVPADTEQAKFTVTLSSADKTAVGKTLTWAFDFSTDNGQTWATSVAGGWTSYGPAGLVAPDGTVNPDPVLIVPLTGRAGQRFRGSLTVNQQVTAGVVIEVN